MTDTFEYAARPGNTALSLAAFAGLSFLTVQLWAVIPGYVLLLLLPALAISLAQMIFVPNWGLRMGRSVWQLDIGRDKVSIPVGRIAYLEVADRRGQTRIAVVLETGERIAMPKQALPDPLVLIREATSRGIPVRHT
ncbi:hypothetical protein N0B44_02460 [Roseibacterium beibuensis]|uniref:PH domain-containing protein n=1 Tax=[Roseibacterium] beibuensis TaxID=1193142 RepID=A0ABP9L1C2_9RHOB|nr:hypothetical protein [Roseibacterium beibuensis]MCS6621766.1 hypothetical protein [Roseibacterium beibuensis]